EGKHRTAQELPKMLNECVTNNTSLKTFLKDVLTFNLSFENGTATLGRTMGNPKEGNHYSE
ncbi:10425_t:CDS:2, partial [Entrophospora sp. SA101]